MTGRGVKEHPSLSPRGLTAPRFHALGPIPFINVVFYVDNFSKTIESNEQNALVHLLFKLTSASAVFTKLDLKWDQAGTIVF